ncbi:NlpC/P60 family protein [Streptomyces purpureus]|uniref:C40 family peptidase n=1 Tax=Streptomyces purpureus TaxID=1951 RepID=UPI0003635EDB|nr:C40 family peptidase [Streptomyces purpureus]
MPALASHRKPRTARTTHSPAVGVTTAALASVTLLSTQGVGVAGATPAPKPTVEEVQKKVDDLYRQAGTATQEYNRAKEATDQQRRTVGSLLDDVAQRTEALNTSRRALVSYAAAQYRTGAISPTAALIFADSPQSYFDQTQLMDRMTDRQEQAVSDFRRQRADTAKKRAEATKSMESLASSQARLRAKKQTVQGKLTEARALLARLTAEERARLAELERRREAEARRKAEEQARAEAARAEAERARREREAAERPSTPTAPTAPAAPESGYATKAAKALAFARAQIGKPYVWGATGPSSYDCSGLTQAAWKEAGVDLPRTTWDQVKAGTRVATEDLRPGDLVFFYDDISHVGIYQGNGTMIHAPKPGANVREESIHYMPIYGSVRPA